ncbi:MAG: intradiol ring-cleavage dioxygenase [Gemmatimonadaceae bacterium]
MKKIDRKTFLSHLGTSVGGSLLGASFITSSDSANAADCKVTPVQELGPYPAMKYRTQPDHDVDLTRIKGQQGVAIGQLLTVFGSITRKDCKPVASAIVEIWSANHYGKYRHEFDTHGQEDPNFQGWGQAITNSKGEYRFTTIIPGLYSDRARHIHFKVSKRGYHELATQMYFEGEERNKTDGPLNQLTHEEQQQIIRPVVEKDTGKQMEFHVVIEEVLTGAVPEKVLKEYVGTYDLKFKGTILEKLQTYVGGPYDNISLQIENEGSQVYMTLSFAPKTEIVWSQKDEFKALAFFHSSIKFTRNLSGKVDSLELNYSGDDKNIIRAIRTE